MGSASSAKTKAIVIKPTLRFHRDFDADMARLLSLPSGWGVYKTCHLWDFTFLELKTISYYNTIVPLFCLKNIGASTPPIKGTKSRFGNRNFGPPKAGKIKGQKGKGKNQKTEDRRQKKRRKKR
jgi:hypothetical protein